MSDGLMLGLEASTPQAEACRKWADKTTDVILFGGAKYGGKSYLGANLIFSDALTYPETTYFISRSQLNDLRKYTTITINEVFADWKVNMEDYATFNGMDNYYRCYNGSLVFFLEGKQLPSDPLFERWGSTQFTRGWIEEGGEFVDLAIENLKATIGRKNNDTYGLRGKLLITCNPKKNVLYREFYRPWSEGALPANLAFIRSLATDNIKGDQEYVKKLSQMKDPTMRARLWAGDWEYDNDPATLMNYDAICDLFTNDSLDHDGKYIVADVARYGSDKTVIGYWEGLNWMDVIVMDINSIPEAAEQVHQMATHYGVGRSRVAVDDDGVGGGVADMLPGCVRFQGGARPIEVKGKEQNYQNLKAQCSYMLADRVNNGMVAVKCGDKMAGDRRVRDYIEEDFAWIKRDKMDTDQKLRILPKEKVKEAIGRSPDFGDVPMMRMIFELRAESLVTTSVQRKVRRWGREALNKQMREQWR